MDTSPTAEEGFGTISVAAILAESAARFPDSAALVVGEERVTYSELWEQTRAYAGALRDRGVGHASRVALLMPNVADFARVYYAVLALGGVVVPMHALLKGREIEYMLRDSGAQLLVCAGPLLEEGAKGAAAAGIDVVTVLVPEGTEGAARLETEAAEAEPISTWLPLRPAETATILYTSGTTGQPKGALGSHFALVEQTSTLLTSTFDLRRGDVIFGGLPMFHTFGQTCVLNTGLRAGATIVMVPKFSGDAALDALARHNINVFFGVPTMYIAMLEAARINTGRSNALRYCISGGASLPVAVMDRFKAEFGSDIYEGYGLTETSPVATFNHVGKAPRPGTVGQAIWGVQVEIARADVPDAIELLPTGELGELVVRGHNLFTGYLNRPEATAEAMVDGWFRTGDLGTKDGDGYLRILDRKKEMIIRNGFNVYPREVEEVLSRHEAVLSVAVYGVPDETHGQEVAAAVVLNPGSSATIDELRDFAAAELAAYKYPRIITLVTEFPTGPSGKVLKRELTARHSAAHSSTA
jgi:long-chain acyl-CoA synthetase